MNPRGILVATKGDDKLYYLLDQINNSDKDGALVSEDGSVELIDFGSYILSEPFLKEYKYSDFHKFLWGRHSGEDMERWERTFVYKTQPVSPDLLKDVKIETSISPRLKSKHYFDNRAIEFKSLNASNQMESMSGVAAGRRFFGTVRNTGRSSVGNQSIDWRSAWGNEGESGQ